MKEEILINTQFALFFDGLIERPDQLVELFNAEMGNIFDKIPVVIPVPNEPKLSEIPVAQLFSTDGIYSCKIARSRVDFFYAGAGKQKFSDIEYSFKNKVEKLYEFFSDNIKIKRMGFVTHFFIEGTEPDKTIAEKLLNDEFRKIHGGDIYEAFIKYVSRDSVNEFEINNFTTVEKFTARISDIGELKGILITRDFNTIPEENYKEKLTNEKIKDFIEKSKEKFKLENINDILWSNQKK